MLQIYNTLARKKESFEPIHKNKVDIFVCGPTVYDYSHLGHARTYFVFDMMAKYLKSQHYKVFYLQNITDIDDKIINRAKEEKISPKELAQKFEKEYLEDMKSLKIDSVTKYARATEHIKEIIKQVKRLRGKGFAYQTIDGIYYNIAKFKGYGKLSRRTVLQAEDAVSRTDEGIGKKNKGDFCLWKFTPYRAEGSGAGLSRPDEPSWPSPWGNGRPGWHIEDTAIAEKYFGAQYDIHGGAIDLIFPHHEAEIAQMEAISGKSPMVKYWLHTGFLTINGQKMAKSLGNFITIQDFLKKHSPEVLRLFVFSTHYRSPIDYTEKAIEQAEAGLERVKEFLLKLKAPAFVKASAGKQNSPHQSKLGTGQAKFQIKPFQKKFHEAMDDDFNTPKAAATIFDLIKQVNPILDKNQLSPIQTKEILNFLKETDKILGILPETKEQKIPEKIQELVKLREKYRQEKNWQKADEIRQEIKKLGYLIKDTAEGTKIRK